MSTFSVENDYQTVPQIGIIFALFLDDFIKNINLKNTPIKYKKIYGPKNYAIRRSLSFPFCNIPFFTKKVATL